LAHGNADQVIPVQAMFAAAIELGSAGACVQWHMAHGVGHGIDPVGLDMAGRFLSLAFRGLLRGQGETSCRLA
jgi:phospholipase/carboxylesterase